ncbi:hypothetical protein [Nocardia brasiliensis]|uniref:hypothetical protein n=1 Tax=Nocardia brasiliensis TaxID=37326 RepID=UPI002455BFA7|nr:hypothetical protein [Nocardia brasiliensis]
MTASEFGERGVTALSSCLPAKDVEALEAAAELLRTALSYPSTEPATAARWQSALGIAQWAIYKITDNPGLLEEAIELGRKAIAGTPQDDAARPARLSNLAMTLRSRAIRDGHGRDADHAVVSMRQAVGSSTDDDPDRPGLLSNLSLCLLTRFECLEKTSDVDEAITVSIDAVQATEHTTAEWDARRITLARALSRRVEIEYSRFEQRGDSTGLDDAIRTCYEITTIRPADPQVYARAESNLCVALTTRFLRAGAAADITAAIDAARKAAALPGTSTALRSHSLAALGAALHARYKRSRIPADLDKAIGVLRSAVKTTEPDDPDLPARISNLALVYRARFEWSQQPEDLEQTLRLSRQATGFDTGRRAAFLLNLATALHRKYELSADRAELAESIAAGTAALEQTAPEDSAQTLILSQLGLAYQAYFELTGDPANLTTAIRYARLATFSNGTPTARLAAAQAWGTWAMRYGDNDSASEAFRIAIGLIPEAAWHGLARIDREHHLIRWSRVPAEATAAALESDATPASHALELLESGRAVMWHQQLQLHSAAGPLSVPTPIIAQRLAALSAELLKAEAGAEVGNLAPLYTDARARPRETCE